MGILGRIAVPLLVAPRSPTGSSSSPETLRVKLYTTESGEALFENAHFTRKYYFTRGTLGLGMVYAKLILEVVLA